MRKVDYRKKENKKENNVVLVATDVITSLPPERRPTGTPHARANIYLDKLVRLHKQTEEVIRDNIQISRLYILRNISALSYILRT